MNHYAQNTGNYYENVMYCTKTKKLADFIK